MNCHECGEIIMPSDNFCEGCGVDLVVKTAAPQLDHKCQKCGAVPEQIDLDRYCSQCGFRQVVIKANDAIELQPTPTLAGASDRGRRHEQNEDAIALSSISTRQNGKHQLTDILVVCDGVSSSQHPELASQAAATAVLQYMEDILPVMNVPERLMQTAMNSALQAVSQIPFDPDAAADPASTTIVVAIVQDHQATIGWLGDSRAYWIAEQQSQQLTADDSWLREVVAAGEMTQIEAEKSPHAHAIVRWLGADITEEDIEPSIVTFRCPSAGYLLLCTDGLWNYAPDPTYLYALIQQVDSTNPLEIARHLVEYANRQGGQDNITVGILAFNQP